MNCNKQDLKEIIELAEEANKLADKIYDEAYYAAHTLLSEDIEKVGALAYKNYDKSLEILEKLKKML